MADGSTTFSEFVDQLIAQGRAPAWRFALDHLSLAAGGTLVGRDIGGETHTFTGVANFGGGCIGFLNGLVGLSLVGLSLVGLCPVPECVGSCGKPIVAYTGGAPPHPWTVYVVDVVCADLEQAVRVLPT